MDAQAKLRRIAIIGPDGSGKSSISTAINEALSNSLVIHVVKDRDYFLKTSYLAKKVWRFAGKFGSYASNIAKYMILYPAEYLENIRRFTYRKETITTYIYDRHPIDRLMDLFELKLKYKIGLVNKMSYWFNFLPTFFWAHIYLYFFPKNVLMIFVLPEPELCYKWADGQYKSIKHAEIRVNSYKEMIKKHNLNSEILTIYVNEKLSVEDIYNIIRERIYV